LQGAQFWQKLFLMTEILQNELPYDVSHHGALPGISPLAPEAWLIVDEAYSAQIQLRETLLKHQRDKVLRLAPEAFAAAQELLGWRLGLPLPIWDLRDTKIGLFAPMVAWF